MKLIVGILLFLCMVGVAATQCGTRDAPKMGRWATVLGR